VEDFSVATETVKRGVRRISTLGAENAEKARGGMDAQDFAAQIVGVGGTVGGKVRAYPAVVVAGGDPQVPVGIELEGAARCLEPE
jgi:hypothetical protein